jgi:integrase
VLRNLRVSQSTMPHFDLIVDDAGVQLYQLFNQDNYLGSRNFKILALLSDTGQRRKEAGNLLIRNVDVDAQVIKVYSDRTEEWHYVPLTDEVAAMLRDHLHWRDRYFAQPSRNRGRGEQCKGEPYLYAYRASSSPTPPRRAARWVV